MAYYYFSQRHFTVSSDYTSASTCRRDGALFYISASTPPEDVSRDAIAPLSSQFYRFALVFPLASDISAYAACTAPERPESRLPPCFFPFSFFSSFALHTQRYFRARSSASFFLSPSFRYVIISKMPMTPMSDISYAPRHHLTPPPGFRRFSSPDRCRLPYFDADEPMPP